MHESRPHKMLYMTGSFCHPVSIFSLRHLQQDQLYWHRRIPAKFPSTNTWKYVYYSPPCLHLNNERRLHSLPTFIGLTFLPTPPKVTGGNFILVNKQHLPCSQLQVFLLFWYTWNYLLYSKIFIFQNSYYSWDLKKVC